MLKWHKLLGSLLLILGGVGGARSETAEPTENPSAKIEWVSTAISAAEFSNEVATLYISLKQNGQLRVVGPVSFPTSSIIEIARQNRLFVGRQMPEELNLLLCDLNVQVCDRLRPSDPDYRLEAQLIRQDQSSPFKPLWKNSQFSPILLPAVALNKIPKWTPYVKKSEDDLSDVVIKKFNGCDVFDESCKDSILAFNRNLKPEVFELSWYGEILLPVIAARALLDVTPAKEGRIVSQPFTAESITLSSEPSSQRPFALPSYKTNPAKGSENSRKDLNNNSYVNGINNAPSSIGKNINGIFKGGLFAVTAAAIGPGDVEKQKIRLWNPMNYTFRKLADIPPIAHGATVAVLDGWVDLNHCALKRPNVNIANISVHAEVARQYCDVVDMPHESVDHGSHVLGIIASLRDDGSEFGLNPHGQTYAREIDFDKLNAPETSASANSQIAVMINDLRLQKHVEVVNMSWGYYKTSGSIDSIENMISDLRYSVLFAVASGNDGADKSVICDLRPACFDLPNVISVAALGTYGSTNELLKSGAKLSTNFGKSIHVAAIGQDVFSTTAFGKYGLMSGSSQAAPQVSFVASLLFTKYPSVKPIEVKNRIIACSDITSALRGKLFGGQLNADCALDGDEGQLQLLTTPNSEKLRGRWAAGTLLEMQDSDAPGSIVKIEAEALRGLQFDKESGTYTVFYTKDKLRSDSQLLKEDNLIFKDSSSKIVFRKRVTGTSFTPIPISVSDLSKYVSPMRPY